MIRRLLPDAAHDVKLVSMGRTFFMEANLPGDFVPAVFSRNWENFISSGAGAIFVLEYDGAIAGAIGGLCHPDVNDDAVVVQEMFWFVRPEFRKGMGSVKLFKALEAWAKEKGAVRFYMGNACNQHMAKVAKFLENLGFNPVGVGYMMDIA